MLCLNTRLTSRFASGLLAASLVSLPGTAAAGPDFDGAVDAVVSWPLVTAGNAFGSMGLVASSVGGAAGDAIALLDDNEYTRIVFRGIFSTTIRRVFLGASNASTGVLAGQRAENLTNSPADAGDCLDPEGLSDRLDSLEAGLGGVYVTAIDFVTGPVLFLTRAVGLTGVADDVTEFKDSRRKRYFGPLKK